MNSMLLLKGLMASSHWILCYEHINTSTDETIKNTYIEYGSHHPNNLCHLSTYNDNVRSAYNNSRQLPYQYKDHGGFKLDRTKTKTSVTHTSVSTLVYI